MQKPFWKNYYFSFSIIGFLLTILIQFVNPLHLKYHEGYTGYGTYFVVLLILRLFFPEKIWLKILIVAVIFFPILKYLFEFFRTLY